MFLYICSSLIQNMFLLLYKIEYYTIFKKIYFTIYFIDDMIKKELKQEVKQEMIQDVNIKQEAQSINSLSPPMRPPPEKKFKPS